MMYVMAGGQENQDQNFLKEVPYGGFVVRGRENQLGATGP